MSQIRRFNSTPHLVRSSIKYKSQEDQYDEIRLLKLQLANSSAESRQLRSQLLRCRNQLQQKYTQLDQCLEQLQQASHSGTQVNAVNVAQLQRRVCLLERVLGERDDQIRSLRADSRLAVLQECRQQLHIYRRQLSRCNRLPSDGDTVVANSTRSHEGLVGDVGTTGSLVERLRSENARLSSLVADDNSRLGVKLACQ